MPVFYLKFEDVQSPWSAPRPSRITPPSPAPAPEQLPEPPPRQKKHRKLALSLLLLLLIAVGSGLIYYFKLKPSPVTGETKKAAPASTTSPQPQLKAVDFADVDRQIQAVIAKYPEFQIAVTYTDIRTNNTVVTGVSDAFNAAATTQPISAVLFLSQVEQGKYTLNTNVGGLPASEQLKRMIETNDSSAWQAFKNLLGNQALKDFAKGKGMSKYDPATNNATTSDIASLLEQLYKQQLLNAENTKLLLEHMEKAPEGQYIQQVVDQGYKVYHQAGILKDRAHDAAIIDNGERPAVIVIFSKTNSGSYNFEKGQKMMQEITTVITAAYKN